MYKTLWGCMEMYEDVLGYIRILRSIWDCRGCIGMYKDVLNCTGMYVTIWGGMEMHFWEYMGGRGCVGVYEDVWNCTGKYETV